MTDDAGTSYAFREQQHPNGRIFRQLARWHARHNNGTTAGPFTTPTQAETWLNEQ